MASSVRVSLDCRYELICKTIKATETRISLLPEGNINIRPRKSGKAYYYFSKKGSKDKILSKDDSSLIHQLLQKRYLKEVLKAAKKELAALEKMLKTYPATLPEDLYEKLPESHRTGVEPVILGDAQDIMKWQNEPYVLKPFKKGAPVFKSMRGERVRSKSEILVTDRFYVKGVPYKYECPLKIGGKIIHPDITAMRPSDHKIVYHEHCGRMDDPQYVNDLVERINLYNQAGIYQGDRLTFTFETENTPFDVRVIDRLIDEFYK